MDGLKMMFLSNRFAGKYFDEEVCRKIFMKLHVNTTHAGQYARK